MTNLSKPTAILTGVAGEYSVAAELSRRGYIASISLRNTRGIDILATSQDGRRSITIQCKTSLRTTKKWILNEKAETFEATNHFYIFVCLGAVTERPLFHIVPSKTVAKHVREEHRRWIASPGIKGQKHNESAVRNFRDPDNEFLERWDSLKLD
jgi:hypothetical protein